MTRFTLLLAVLASSLVLNINAFSQSVFTEDEKKLISDIKKKMDDDELGKMSEAENTFEEARYITDNVNTEDQTLVKAFEKGSTPKAEKKAVNVKRNRIEAAKLHEKAYNLTFEACDTRLGKLKFQDTDKQGKAKDARSQGSEKMTAGTTKGDDYKFLEDKDLETVKYDDLKAKIDDANKLFKDGITLQFDAWNLFFTQFSGSSTTDATVAEEKKTEPEVKTEPAVATVVPSPTQAESNNVVIDKKEEPVVSAPAPVQTIIPTPATTQPEKKTEEIKPVAAVAPAPVAKPAITKTASAVSASAPISKPKPTRNTAPGGIVYRVQLAAIQRGQLPDNKKQELYSGPKTLFEEQENGMYKYRVGDFTSYSEAKRFIEEYGRESFLVKYVNGIKQ